jgi:Peptidoglycan-binding protein, CsiV
VLLQDSRRLRTGEVSYIDHPMLGVVAKISSLEAPATAPAEPADVPPPSTPTL